ncbi:MAG: glycosyltransferase family 4 protein [Deltaproteobacteria bacterium]|nr:glycosyltransferase family 4 protein [Deltaproteobacteria bacterium]MBW2285793.1 glycosyltransferase family 4 protein [Deltaproteobacteria bacterium]
MRPLRFCMITTFYPPYHFGGDALFVYHLSNLLADRGHHVEVIHCLDSFRMMARAKPEQDVPARPGVVVHGLESPLGPLSPLATQQTGHPLFKAARLRRILGEGFDVIHFHNISLIGGPGILRYGAGLKLYTTHEYWLLCPMHNFFQFNRRLCRSRHCISCSLAHGRPPQWWRYSGLMHRSLKRIDALIAPSLFAGEKHASAGVDVPIVHLPGFVPDADANQLSDPRSPDLKPPGPYFLFVGRLERLKGLERLIRMFRGYGKATLAIAGRGGDRARLEKAAGASGNIRFYGHVSGRPLADLYRNAVALIIPSLVYEVSPLVILEAFQHGTPVIAGNRGVFPEMVGTTGGGWIYDRDEELVSVMDSLLSDRGLRDNRGRRGREAYDRAWSPRVHLNRYLDLIDRLRKGKPRGV